jgi:hypothetical protein
MGAFSKLAAQRRDTGSTPRKQAGVARALSTKITDRLACLLFARAAQY